MQALQVQRSLKGESGSGQYTLEVQQQQQKRADLLATLDEFNSNKFPCLLVPHQLCHPEVAAANIPYLRGRYVVSMASKHSLLSKLLALSPSRIWDW